MSDYKIAESFIDTVKNDALAYQLEGMLEAGYPLSKIIQEYVAWQE